MLVWRELFVFVREVFWSFLQRGDNIPKLKLHYGSVGKESACNAGDLGSIPGLGRSPVEENGNPLQNSCLENSMERGARQATVHGITKSQTWLRDYHFFFFLIIMWKLTNRTSFEKWTWEAGLHQMFGIWSILRYKKQFSFSQYSFCTATLETVSQFPKQ